MGIKIKNCLKMAAKSEALFNTMKDFLEKNGKDLVPKVKYIYRFVILEKKGGKTLKTYTVDLKNGSGSVKEGTEGKVDATFTISDADMIAMANRTLNPQNAFMQGKMKIKGNMAAATKFTPDLLPPLPKL